MKVYIFWKEMTQGIQPAKQIFAKFSFFEKIIKFDFTLLSRGNVRSALQIFIFMFSTVFA